MTDKSDKTAASTAGNVAVKSVPGDKKSAAAWPDIERVFEDFLSRRWIPTGWERPQWPDLPAFRRADVPSVDILDHDVELVVRAEIPGIDKKDLDVSVVDKTLTIKGESHSEKKEEKDDYYRREIRSGSFSRSVVLPVDVDASKATASYKDGIVELHLPKTAQAKRQQIRLG